MRRGHSHASRSTTTNFTRPTAPYIKRAIPAEVAKLAVNLTSGSRLIEDIDLFQAYLMDLKVTCWRCMVFPLPAISRFSLPEPFKGKQFTTTALIHGTPLDAAQNILLEGFIRPAN